MRVLSGPPRYFFLRRARGVREELAHWPPADISTEPPANAVCVAVRLHPTEGAWQAEGVDSEAALKVPADGAFVLTRDTMLGLTREYRSPVTLALLGVRVVKMDDGEFTSHLVVRATGGLGPGAPTGPLVVPVSAMILGQYIERGSYAEAELDLRLSPAQIVAAPAYMADARIHRIAGATLDQAILSPVARHAITFETMAGRVSLYGRSDLTALGEDVRAALVQAPGVVDVDDHIIYVDQLKDLVERALAAKGLADIAVLAEHGLISLRGVVSDARTRYKAKDTAASIPGVRGVIIQDLKVAENAAI
ncbi:MAG TPA: BON domain-containing protein [Ktedonobacterales bacterium]